MKDLKFYSRLIISIGLLLWALFQFTKDKFRWPVFIADNIFYISMAFTAIGYVLLYSYYKRTKNPGKAKELVITAIALVAFFGLVYLVSK